MRAAGDATRLPSAPQCHWAGAGDAGTDVLGTLTTQLGKCKTQPVPGVLCGQDSPPPPAPSVLPRAVQQL